MKIEISFYYNVVVGIFIWHEWKILWHVIKNYNHGKFDEDCRDILELEKSRVDPQESFIGLLCGLSIIPL